MRWSYKIVHYDYKKEGLLGGTFLDEAEIEQSMNELGKAGWELISTLEVQDGLTATFKQPFEEPPLRRTRPISEGRPAEGTVQTSRFLRPERVQKPVISRGDEIQQRDAAGDENESAGENMPVDDIPASPPPRTIRPAQTNVEKKRSTGEDNNNGGAGSIRIE